MTEIRWLGVAVMSCLVLLAEIRSYRRQARRARWKSAKMALTIGMLFALAGQAWADPLPPLEGPLGLEVPAIAPATAETLLSIPGMVDAIAEAVKHSRAIGLIDFEGKFSIGSYVPLRTLHDSAGKEYLKAGFGGAIKQGQGFRPRFVVEMDLSQTWRKLEGRSAWYEAHVSKIKLPDFWLGLAPSPPLDGSFTWASYRSWLNGSISMGF